MLKVLELFAGIGACSKALERLGIEHEIVDAVEIDKYAIASFNAIHGTNFETQDITTWDKDLECDLIMHGSPCQDFSVAGKQAGGDVGSGTRSSLMYETIRIVGKLRPKYVVWENVKNLLSKKHKHNFDAYIETMNILGYNSYYQVLNAKDYGIPQNRERVFTVSIRKDIDSGYNFPNKETLEKNLQELLESNVEEKYFLSEKGVKYVLKRVGGYVQLIDNDTEIAHCPITAKGNTNWTGNFVKFEFPPKEKLKLRLKDMLEEQVDEKYYLSDKMMNYVLKPGTKGYMKEPELNNEIAEPKCEQVGTLDIKGQDIIKRVYSDKGLAPTLTQQEEKILVKNATKKGYDEAIDGDSINLSYPESTTRRGRVGHGVAQTLQCNDSMGVVEKEYERTPLKFLNRNQKNIDGDYAFCVDSCNTGGVKEIEGSNLRIRKLTTLETWRLMGFDDEDFEKAKTALNEKFYKGKDKSSSQLYKQAGNSIVVNVLEKIFNNLLEV